MKVLVPLHGFARWNGGLDLVRLLVAAIDSVADRRMELTFAIPAESGPSRLLHASVRQVRQIVAGNFVGSSTGSRATLVRTALQMIGDRSSIQCRDNATGINQAADALGADIVFPTLVPLGAQARARVGYVTDFQHRHLPDLFPARMRKARDKQFRRIADESTGVVVNSRTVAQDVAEFLEFPKSRILTLPFSPYALPHWFDASPEVTQRRYGLDARYLLICNHFWKHKDHATALRAFAQLRANPDYGDLQMVMTGDPIDHREPAHYPRLQKLTRQLGLTDSTHFLGLIPKHDQLALLRGCTALLQPTRFEGGPGGGAVYEAIGLGVPVVVSDIPINLEIDQGSAYFFRAGDHSDLAKQVITALSRPLERLSQSELLAIGKANLSRLGISICDYLDSIYDLASGVAE